MEQKRKREVHIKNFILLISLCFLVNPLVGQNNIQIEISATSSEETYSIEVRDSIYALSEVKDGVQKKYSRILKKCERRKLCRLISKIDNSIKSSDDFSLDTWIFKVHLDKTEHKIDKSLLFNDLKAKDLKRLIKYVMKMSPSNIYLRDFS